MLEDYKIRLKSGRAMPTGAYETTRIGTQRAITMYTETYLTVVGELSPEEWFEKLHNAILEENETDLLEKIIEFCSRNCVWLHSKHEIEEYAMNCIAGRYYKEWKDFEI